MVRRGPRTLETDSIDELAAERGGGGFGWLGLRMPTDDELNEVAKAFDIPELAIADARHKHDRPKVEVHDDCLLTVVPTARYVDAREEVEFGELFFYAGRDYLVTVRYGQAAPLPGVRAELERAPRSCATVPAPCCRRRCCTSCSRTGRWSTGSRTTSARSSATSSASPATSRRGASTS